MTSPPKLPADQQRQLVALLEHGIDRITAARSVGLSAERLDEVLEDTAVRAVIEEAEAKADVRSVLLAQKAAAKGDRKAMAWLLARETQAPGETPAPALNTKPMPAKMRRFADVWEGNHTEAAIKAGASKRSASTLGARWIQDERVLARIAERRAAGELPAELASGTSTSQDRTATKTAGPTLPTSSAADAYRAVIGDPTIAMGIRLRAIEKLEALEAATRTHDDVEAFKARLQAKVTEELRKKRERERAHQRAA